MHSKCVAEHQVIVFDTFHHLQPPLLVVALQKSPLKHMYSLCTRASSSTLAFLSPLDSQNDCLVYSVKDVLFLVVSG